MIDPDDVEVDPDVVYFRANRRVGRLVHPDDRDLHREDARLLSVQQAQRGSWRVRFIEVPPGDEQDATATALEQAEASGYDRLERLEPSEFQALLEDRPDYEYLRVGSPATARNLIQDDQDYPSVGRVSEEELAALTDTEATNNH